MLKLICAFVGITESVIEVDIAENASVTDLMEEIKTRSDGFITVHTLQLFLAKTKDGKWVPADDGLKAVLLTGDCTLPYLEMHPKWFLNNLILFGSNVSLGEGVIHVLVVVPPRVTPTADQCLTFAWTLADEPCPVLNFQESDRSVIIPEEYAEGSGLLVNEGGLRLYLRPGLKGEWTALNDNVVKSFTLQWIEGAPGTGKSCAAFAFACSLKRGMKWDVLWIHCPKTTDTTLLCIMFRGDSEKRTCEISRSQLDSILQSLCEKAIAFVDGYVQSRDEISVLQLCMRWRTRNPEDHRIVVVNSMVSIEKNYRPDCYRKINTDVTSSLESLAILSPTVSGEEHRYVLPSWTREDYKEAMTNEVFFEHVRSEFTDSDGDVELEERFKLLDTKFFIAGASARMMFDVSSEEAMDLVRFVVYVAARTSLYVPGSIELFSDDAVNRLLSWYRDGAHLEAKSDPNVDSGLTNRVMRFDPDGVIPLTQREQWLAPNSWNQGSYDAVFVEFLELSDADIKAKNTGFAQKMLVRFVQLTSSTTHPFKVGFFEEFLSRLACNSWLYAVEVCFVGPMENMSEFLPSMSANDFKREAFSAFEADLPITISTQVLGLRYNYSSTKQGIWA